MVPTLIIAIALVVVGIPYVIVGATRDWLSRNRKESPDEFDA